MERNCNTRVRVPIQASRFTCTDSQESHDAAPLNPTGRGLVDYSAGGKGTLLRCKNTLLIATMNVRTIRLKEKREEVAFNFNVQSIDILGLQEHRIVHDEPVKYETVLGNTLITTSAWRNEAGAATGGVGVLLNNKSKKCLKSVTPISQRIIALNFIGNPACTIIVVYSPTNTAEEDSINTFYDNLRKAIEAVPSHNVLIIVGDFNAHIGSDDGVFVFHDKTNRNGKLLADMATEKSLIISNTLFHKKKNKLWTYISPSGAKCQLDYILIRKKWRNSIHNAEAYNSFASVGSDHRIITSRIRLSLRSSCKSPPKQLKLDWSRLRENKALQEQYTITLSNRFQALALEEQTSTEKYESFITANQETAKELLPTVQKEKKRAHSRNPKVIEQREAMKQAYEDYQENTTSINKQKLEEAKQNLANMYTSVAEEDLATQIKQVEEAEHQHKYSKSWELINEITGRRSSAKGQLKGDTQQDRIQNWLTHFQSLLGTPPDVENENEEIPQIFHLNIKTTPFDKEEYEKAKQSTTEGKSCGEDGVTPEVLKRCNIDSIILDFCNAALLKREKPAQWSMLNIVPIPKSGDLSLGSNYRGISLSSIVAKTYNRMILNRIRPEIDKKLRINQNGFRPGRTTTCQILALRRLIEGVKEYRMPAVITFIDFCKAFDTIHRGKMLRILTAYGVPKTIVDAIGDTYSETRAKVLSPDGITDDFEITAGVLQGDTLAPYLFVIVLDYALRKAIDGKESELGLQISRRRSRRCPAKFVTDLDFADDIALISEEIQQAQSLLERVEGACREVGLKMNAKKTKVLQFNQKGQVNITSKDGAMLDVVDDFKYLGSMMISTVNDIKVRKAMAWRACNKIEKIWKTKLKRDLKIRLLTSTVEAILLYGSETWSLSKKQEKELDGCYTRLLRKALNVSWKDHVTNRDLYGEMPKITEKIRVRRLKLAGHCGRHPEEVASNLVLWEPDRSTRDRGRPRNTYLDTLKKDTGLGLEELRTCMQDREQWQTIIARARESSK